MNFNSDQYAWKDLSVVYLGRTITGVQGLKYKKKVEKEYVYGSGNKPRGIQTGNVSVDGTLMLLQSELELLQTAIKAIDVDSDITDIALDIVATYGEGNLAKTDMVVGVNFTEFEKGMNQEDKFMKISLPFVAMDVRTIT